MISLGAAVARVRALGSKALVAIDGLPVAGKSTLAGVLENTLGARCLYLDDFVRPAAHWRGIATPAFPFPYIRYADFLGAVQSLGAGRPARYRRYDWQSGELEADLTTIEPDGLIVVEGVSALHANLAPLYDLRLWVESDAASTLQAAMARGAGDWAEDWRILFMPSVKHYLASDPCRRADFVVAGRGLTGG